MSSRSPLDAKFGGARLGSNQAEVIEASWALILILLLMLPAVFLLVIAIVLVGVSENRGP